MKKNNYLPIGIVSAIVVIGIGFIAFGQASLNKLGATLVQIDVRNTCNSYAFATKWGQDGTRSGDFNTPFAVATDSTGNVYVTDFYNSRVQKFTSTGQYISQWGSQGSGNGQFIHPAGIVVDSQNNVYVADYANFRIQKFTSNGVYISQWGSQGSGNGQFQSPLGLALDSTGNIYVTDQGFNHRIQKFTSTGQYIAQWGTQGSGNGQFINPVDIAIDSAGNVYITDVSNNRVQKFTSNGVYITQWGTYGSGNGQFIAPQGIDVDLMGNVYITDSLNHRVQKFTSNGVYLSQFGTMGSVNGQFNSPMGIKVDVLGNIYVADAQNFRIQKFSPNCKTALPVPLVPINTTLPIGTKDYCPNISGIQASIPTGYVVDRSGNCVKQVIITPTTLQNTSLLTASSTTESCAAATAPWIKVISPNGGETYQGGQSVEVKWKSCNLRTQIDLGLDYILPNGNVDMNFAVSLAFGTNNDGTETVMLPESYRMSSFGQHFKVRAGIHMSTSTTATQPYDYSDNLFTINP